MDEKQKKQQRMMELEYYSQQLQSLDQERSRFAMKRIEIEGAKRGLSETMRAGDNAEVMFPIGAGVFLSGKVTDAKSATVSVGADIAVQKNIPDAEKFLDEQLANIERAILSLDQNLAEIDKRARALSKELG